MTALPLVYEEIKQDLLGRIGRQWPEGARLPAVPELARELGTGQRNTLRAMQELVREGYLRSRPGRGTFVARTLPDAPDAPVARSRRPRRAPVKARVLIMLDPRGRDGFLLEIAQSVEEAVRARHLDVEHRLVMPPYDLRKPPYRDFDAFAIINPDRRRIQLEPRQSAVVISTINLVNVEAIGGFDIVTVEEEHGGLLAGRLLRDTGHTEACFIGVRHRHTPTVTDPTSVLRLRGFEAGFGRPVRPDHLLWGGAYCEASGAVALAQYMALTPRPRAIFAASDELAIGFAIAGLGQGLKPGHDFELVGFDGQHRGRHLAECPALTSVAVPSAEMGRRAAELLVERLQRPDKPLERVLLGCSIFTGGTVSISPSSSSQESSS